MSAPARYAVIPTRDRPTELAAAVTALHAQDVQVIVVDNGSVPPASPPIGDDGHYCWVLIDPEQPPNLSRLWNLGIDMAAKLASDAGHTVWDVAVINDDAMIPDGWYGACSAAMREHGAAAACTDPHRRLTVPLIKTQPDRDVFTRMCGWAFLLRGERGLRTDETLRWWFGDTDLDWQARQQGGMVIIPGYPVGNTLANTTTVGELAAQAGRDRATFERKWGQTPW